MAGFENAIATLKRTEQDLERQLESVRSTIAVLSGQAGGGTLRGRPPGTGKRGPGRPKGSGKKRGRRKMSAEARAKIAAAQKKRWAKLRAEQK